MADDDSRDVDRVLAGEKEAFAGVVRRWQGPLVNLAFRFCRDEGRAEEMAHDVFLKAFRSLARWRRESRFSTWLFAVALNHYRSCMRRTGPPLVSLDEVDLVDASQPVDRVLEIGQQAELVRHVVAALPEKYREALTMFYLKELDVREVAEALGIPDGTLKARLHRGREMLRSVLEQRWKAEEPA